MVFHQGFCSIGFDIKSHLRNIWYPYTESITIHLSILRMSALFQNDIHLTNGTCAVTNR